MRLHTRLVTWTCAAVMAAAPAAAWAQDSGVSALQAPPVEPYVVGQGTPPVPAGGRLLDLTLDQAIELALEKNLDLKAARLAPQAVDYQLSAARAAFSPVMSATYGFSDQD